MNIFRRIRSENLGESWSRFGNTSRREAKRGKAVVADDFL
jgi:hypothetical protein